MSRKLNLTERGQLAAMIQRTSLRAVLEVAAPGLLTAVDDAEFQMGQCEKMFRDDEGFMQCLSDLRDETQWGGADHD